MPRSAHLDTPGIIHHIMIRGIERRPIFRNDEAREDLLERISLLRPETQTACYAWAFLPNHAHFLFQSSPQGSEQHGDWEKACPQPAVGYAVRREEVLARERGFKLEL
ncbi:MAG: hypothetical protein A2Y79_07855 [Deltaproteobacteria bacterium RBG_13_43_22]|nr:MAG: hypothetical protein A2Y79_07855 [Deltaproteobacteria bacterium RBG_13_43_22]